MVTFVTATIESGCKRSLEKGREKYTLYFIKNHAKWADIQDEVDANLIIDGWGDVIIAHD